MLAALSIPDNAGLVAILTIAFGAGMIHALDADHIAAVAGLAARRASWTASIRAAGAWALGHGLTLLAIGSVVYLLGLAIPDRLSAFAEQAVGFILIAIGLSVLYQFVAGGVHVHSHVHDDLPSHTHLHTHDGADPDAHATKVHYHDHRSVLVGMVHGAAGTAPLLALIPLSQIGSAWTGIAYLTVFGIGVMVAMLAFGGAVGGLFVLGSNSGRRLISTMQVLTGVMAIGFGAWLIAVG